MIKGLLLDLLQRYIGEYVKTDDRSLRVALQGGHLELRDVEVRREAFDRFGLPFVVKAGYVGLLRVELPRLAVWRSGGADEAISVQIESAYLLVAPRSDGRGLSLPRPRGGAEARREKEKALAAAEELLRTAGAAASSGGALRLLSSLSNGGLHARLLSGLIDLLHVSLRNVHVRCEDEGALTGGRLNAGLILAEAEFRPSARADEEGDGAGARPARPPRPTDGAPGEPPPPPPRTPAASEPARPIRALRKTLSVRALLLYLEPGGEQIPVEFLDAVGLNNDGSAEMRVWFEQKLLPPDEAVVLLSLIHI